MVTPAAIAARELGGEVAVQRTRRPEVRLGVDHARDHITAASVEHLAAGRQLDVARDGGDPAVLDHDAALDNSSRRNQLRVADGAQAHAAFLFG